MRIRLLASSIDGGLQQFSATYLINDTLALDAGSLGFAALDVQRKVRHLLLTHSHLDHVGSLPIFLDNVYRPGPECVSVHAGVETRECLERDVFNERLWPDLLRIAREESPFLRFVPLFDRHPVTLEGLRITPVALDHLVPTFGFLIDDGASAVAFVSDTGPTQAVWELAREQPRLRAVFLECAFPDSLAWLAEKACHLTPQTLAAEWRKLDRPADLLAVHIKPAYHAEIVAELEALRLPELHVATPGREYVY